MVYKDPRAEQRNWSSFILRFFRCHHLLISEIVWLGIEVTVQIKPWYCRVGVDMEFFSHHDNESGSERPLLISEIVWLAPSSAWSLTARLIIMMTKKLHIDSGT
jgi:hypothetical protein